MARQPLKVLLVEDNPDDAALLSSLLGQEWNATLHMSADLAGYRQALPAADWDVILCDFALNGDSALTALSLLVEAGLDIPFIIVSGAIGEETAIEALQAGAADYLLKDRPARLNQAIRRALELRAARRERAAVEAGKLQMLHMLNHEFRTPLTYVRGYAYMLEDETISQDDRRIALQGLKRGETRLRLLIEGFLVLTGLLYGEQAKLYRDGRKPFVDWLPLVSRVIERHELRAQMRGLEIGLKVAERLPVVVLHEGQIEQVVERLWDNAIKFTPAGRVWIDVRPTAGGVQVEVGDTGRGLDANDLPRLFRMFEQVDREIYEQQGAGIGLAVVKGLLDLHGGRVAVDSQPGAGAVFRVWLPELSE